MLHFRGRVQFAPTQAARTRPANHFIAQDIRCTGANAPDAALLTKDMLPFPGVVGCRRSLLIKGQTAPCCHFSCWLRRVAPMACARESAAFHFLGSVLFAATGRVCFAAAGPAALRSPWEPRIGCKRVSPHGESWLDHSAINGPACAGALGILDQPVCTCTLLPLVSLP